MLTFSEYRRTMLEGDLKMAPGAPTPPKKVASMFPQIPNVVDRHRAARAKWQGEKKAALRQASMRLLAKQKKSGVAVKPETDSISGDK